MANRKQEKTSLLPKAGDHENSEISEISGRAFVVVRCFNKQAGGDSAWLRPPLEKVLMRDVASVEARSF